MESHSLTLARDHPDVLRLVAELTHLRACADAAARGAVKALTSGPQGRKYWPSQISRTGRRELAAVYCAAYARAIQSRLPQMRRANRKLARVCPAWRLLEDDGLTAASIPHFGGFHS